MNKPNPSHAVAAALVGLSFACTPALSTPPVDVPVENHSFEDPILGEGEFGNMGVAPWSKNPQFGPINLFEFLTNGPVPDGENVAFSSLFDETAEQVLDVFLCENDQITLTVAVGQRTDFLTFGGYILALEAEIDIENEGVIRIPLATVTSFDDGAVIPAPGDFVDITVNASVDSNKLTGARLVVRIGSFAEQGVTQSLFDDVRVSIQTNSLQVPSCYPTIQSAIDAADPGDEIVVQVGEYYETIDFMGKGVTLRSTDPINEGIARNTIIASPFGRGIFGDPERLVTFNSGEGPDTVIDGITLEGFGADIDMGALVLIEDASPTIRNSVLRGGNADLRGGAVYMKNASPTFEDCRFAENRAAISGGMVYINEGSAPTFTGCEFFYGGTDFGSGGAIYIAPDAGASLTGCDFGLLYARDFGGAIYMEATADVSLTECAFLGKTHAAIGGAIFSLNASPTLTDCFFGGNEASEGGAMFAYAGAPTLVGCTFIFNQAVPDMCCGGVDNGCCGIVAGIGSSSGAGGAYAQHFGEASFTDCFFSGNAGDAGGAINAVDADLTIVRSEFLSNRTSSDFRGGGEGGAVRSTGGFVTVTGSYFADNSAYGAGGGLFLHRFGGGGFANGVGEQFPLANVTNCVFDRNRASTGGGAFIQGTGVTVANCTFVANDGEFRYDGSAGALAAFQDGTLNFDIAGCIMWDNFPDQLVAEVFSPGSLLVSNSCIQGGLPEGGIDGGGNIMTFPRFVDINGLDNDAGAFEDNDYHLAMNSPCIDAGNSTVLLLVDASNQDFDLLPRLVDDPGIVDAGQGVVDMGAFEFQGSSDPRCNDADLATPFGILDFDDVLRFLLTFETKGVDADLSPVYGELDFNDVIEYLTIFGAGCK